MRLQPQTWSMAHSKHTKQTTCTIVFACGMSAWVMGFKAFDFRFLRHLLASGFDERRLSTMQVHDGSAVQFLCGNAAIAFAAMP